MPGAKRADSGVTVHAKVWIERNGHVVMSDYRARLLKAIAETGSVAAAAKAMRLPNRTAWKKIREAEAAAGVPLVESDSGGASGGQSRLTEAGAELLEAFEQVLGPVEVAVEAGFRRQARHFASI